MESIFTKIINDELGHFVYKDDECVVLLDIRPANRGHCLVIPRHQVDEWTDLDTETMVHLTRVAQTIGKAQKKALECTRIGMMIAGFEVPHCHIHLIPIDSMADFELGGPEVDPNQLKNVAQLISEQLT